MTLTDDIQQRLAAAEAAAREFMDKRTPWEVAADEHELKVQGLHDAWQALKATQEATEAARRQAARELKKHGAALVSVDLEDVEGWANETARLRRLVDALGERYRLQSSLVEHAQRQYEAALQDNPAAAVKSAHVRQLRSIVSNPRTPRDEVARAGKELEKIFNEGRPVVFDLSPEIDKRLYNDRGMLIDGL